MEKNPISPSSTLALAPSRIEKFSPTEMLVAWNQGETYAVPFVEIRFFCPCAYCVDEHTGERTILRSSIDPEIRPASVQVVGRYAVQIAWTDRHSTGIYSFDRLHDICEETGRLLKSA